MASAPCVSSNKSFTMAVSRLRIKASLPSRCAQKVRLAKGSTRLSALGFSGIAAMNCDASPAIRGSTCVVIEVSVSTSNALVNSSGCSARKMSCCTSARRGGDVYFTSPRGLSNTMVSPSVNSQARPQRPATLRNSSDEMGLCSAPCHVSQSTRIVKRNGRSTPSASVVVAAIAMNSRFLCSSFDRPANGMGNR